VSSTVRRSLSVAAFLYVFHKTHSIRSVVDRQSHFFRRVKLRYPVLTARNWAASSRTERSDEAFCIRDINRQSIQKGPDAGGSRIWQGWVTQTEKLCLLQITLEIRKGPAHETDHNRQRNRSLAVMHTAPLASIRRLLAPGLGGLRGHVRTTNVAIVSLTENEPT
jgi:hypothetical protein